MKILVRLPNWLGDLVMSCGFLNLLREVYPQAEITVIIKSGLDSLTEYLPAIDKFVIFDRKKYKGLRGIFKFCVKELNRQGYDLYFSLPDSFSAAWMGWLSRSQKRIGYRGNWRNLLLNHALNKPQNLHRAEEYINLISPFFDIKPNSECVKFKKIPQTDEKKIDDSRPIVVFNINSVAVSRRLPVEKAVEFAQKILTDFAVELIFVGAKNEREFIKQVTAKLDRNQNWQDLSGSNSLLELIKILAIADFILTTDSGPAHLGAALGKKTIVLFGAGNPKNTAPYSNLAKVITTDQEKCLPCVKNNCRYAAIPSCMNSIPYSKIQQALQEFGLELKIV